MVPRQTVYTAVTYSNVLPGSCSLFIARHLHPQDQSSSARVKLLQGNYSSKMAVVRPLVSSALSTSRSHLSALALRKEAHRIIHAAAAGAWSRTPVRRSVECTVN